MAAHTSLARRAAARLLIALLAALCLAAPVVAGPGEGRQEKTEAATVASDPEKEGPLASVDEWVKAFKLKRAQIVDQRCPA